MRRSHAQSEGGFTLIEVMAAALILLVGVLGAVGMVDGANRATFSIKAREAGNNLAREIVEGTRSVPYPDLLPTSIENQLQAQPGLEDDSTASGWTIRRRNFTYTVTVSVCSLDDPKDGVSATHDAGLFCADTATVGDAGTTVDKNSDDYKRVVVTLGWDRGTGKRSLRQTSIINNSGNAFGPAVVALTMTSPGANPITTNASSATFSLTTSSAATVVSWSVDGSTMGTASGSGTAWTIPSWSLSSLDDGAYIVSADAFDATGLTGASRSITVTLNRFAPRAPTGALGGRNGAGVDVEWLPNNERDIVGYRVYRYTTSPSTLTLACALTTLTECRDSSPPSGSHVYYLVRALDRDPSNALREGADSGVVDVTNTNTAPNAPTNLLASSSAGTTILTWTLPSAPTDPDPGDSIKFFRIYRDGSTYADRYDRTGLGTDVTWTDADPDGTTHTYMITAVDSQLTESTMLGPVTR